jgi:hypothetical protein
MKYYDMIPEWVRITGNQADRPAPYLRTGDHVNLSVNKHLIREIIYTFEELTVQGVPTGMFFEFDDPAIAADEMGVSAGAIKDTAYRIGGTRVGNYIVTSRVADKEVIDTTPPEKQGELFV